MRKFILGIVNLPAMIYNFLFLKLRKVQYGKNLCISGRICIRGKGIYVIGENVIINSKPFENPTACGYMTSLNCFNGATIIIGNNVGISHTAISAMEKVEIGDNVLIGSNCMIADTDFHPIDTEKRIANDRTAIKTAPIKIENNVFIGARSIILKGVTIGENSIVGAGSVVTKTIPANEIWAGNPAKFIKKI